MSSNHDQLQRFLFTDLSIRGEIIRLHESYHAISDRYDYPLPVRKLLGQALATTALLSEPLEEGSSLILQIQSDGPIHLVVSQSKYPLQIRGLAKWEGEISDEHLKDLGEGTLAMTITAPNGQRYQGLTELKNHSLNECIVNYFEQSEQLPTWLHFFANEEIVVGILLQIIPDASQSNREEVWETLQYLANTVTDIELIELSNETLIHRLFHEYTIQLFEGKPIAFSCDCNREKMNNAINMLTEEDIQEIFSTHKVLTITCEFCQRENELERPEVEEIRRDKDGKSH